VRSEPNLRLDRHRTRHPAFGDSPAGANYGFFVIGDLRVVSSGGGADAGFGWEHVSVSCANRCPTWEEMDKVKRLFWRDDETVVQFHPRDDVRVNVHPYCLHLWKRCGQEYELPPRNLIA
jgi:hypothetical protein